MFSTELSKIKIKDFKDTLQNISLKPSKQILLKDIDEKFKIISSMKVKNLKDLHELLKNRDEYPQLANKLNVPENYLVLLNREVENYIAESIPLKKLKVFSNIEIEDLTDFGIENTQELYEKTAKKDDRDRISSGACIDEKKIIKGLQLADLTRINGIGLIYAKVLLKMGITSKKDFENTSSKDLLKKFIVANKGIANTKSSMGIEDLNYSKKYSISLDNDIEW